MRVRGAAEFDRTALDHGLPAAADSTTDLQTPRVRLQFPVAGDASQNLQTTFAAGRHEAVVGERSVAEVDLELMGCIRRSDDAIGLVDEGQLAAADITETIDGVVVVVERIIGRKASHDPVACVRERDNTAALQLHVAADVPCRAGIEEHRSAVVEKSCDVEGRIMEVDVSGGFPGS